MNFQKSLVEFIGTYLALVAIILAATNIPKNVSIVVGLAFFIVVFLFQDISANFNPAVTLMFVSLKKQPVTDLITLIIPQLLAGLAAAQTFVLIKKFI
jgi:glycerol uptake facilitator-like aquaporin